MQVQSLCSIKYLEINPAHGGAFFYNWFVLTNDPVDLYGILDTELKRLEIGGNRFKQFENKLYFFSHPRDYPEKADAFNAAKQDHDYLKRLMMALWLVRDNSCNVPYFLSPFPDNSVYETSSNTFYSNCRGEYSTVEFTHEEFDEASGLADLIDEFVTSEQQEQPDIKPEQINRGAVNFAPYNTFARIERAYLFLQLARSASFLPQKISYYVLLLECLFSADKGSEILHKVAERLALYLGGNKDEKLTTYKTFKRTYDIRSGFFHGQVLGKDKSDFLINQSEWLDSTIRILFRKILLEDSDKFKLEIKEFQEWLTSLVFQ